MNFYYVMALVLLSILGFLFMFFSLHVLSTFLASIIDWWSDNIDNIDNSGQLIKSYLSP